MSAVTLALAAHLLTCHGGTLVGKHWSAEDLESHDGSAERPYYMSKSLLKILNKQNMPAKRQ